MTAQTARPPGVTHAACGQVWRGASACHCSGCHETWGGLTIFDADRTRDGRCLAPADTKGVERNVDGIWRGAARPDGIEHAA